MGGFPNKDTQFKPGNPGGPGPTPGTKHISTHIQNALNDPKFDLWLQDPREGFKKHDGIPLEAVIRVAIIRAAAGDDKAREWLAKYGYGQKIDLGGGELVIKLVSYTDAASPDTE